MRRAFAMLSLALLALAIAPAAEAFSAAPATTELGASRGQLVDATFTLVNTEDRDETYYLSVLKFEAQAETGSPRFIPYEEDHGGMPEWIVFQDTEVAVPARSRVEVPYQIAVPSDAQSGGHYAAIVISDAPSAVVATSGASIQAKTALLLFLTVQGETREQAALLDFAIERGEPSGLNGTFRWRIQNQGNVHVVPEGTVTFKNALGWIIGKTDANETDGRVLPGSTRTFEGSWSLVADDLPLLPRLAAQARVAAIGPVTASLDITYGASGVLSQETAFFYWPIELIAFVLLTLVAAVILFSIVRQCTKR